MKHTIRWILVAAFALALALGVGTAAPNPASPLPAANVPDHITLTWTGDPATTQTITWRTGTSAQAGLVQYQAGATLAFTAPKVTAEPRTLPTDLGEFHLFTAVLTHLTPKTTYSYRVGDGKMWSEKHTFMTADPDLRPLKFLIFGDSQSGVAEPIYSPWATTAHNAFKANADARFMVNMGDLVEIGQSAAHWDGWFAGAQGVIDTIPEMPVEGNHETYSYFYGPIGGKPRLWGGQFALPQNGPAGLKGQVYSFDYGPAHFVILDSQQTEEQGAHGTMLQEQAQWLERDLAASKAPWKLAFFHKTPYDLKALRHSPEVRKAFCPVFDKCHLDVAFVAHDHGIARTWPLKADRAAAKPSEGTVYYITGRSGNKSYPDLLKKPVDAYFFDPQKQPVYLVVEVADQRLTVKSFEQDGTLLDTFFLDKGQDADTDTPNLPNPPPAWSE